MTVDRVHHPDCNASATFARACVQPGCPCWCHDTTILELPPRHGHDTTLRELVEVPA